MTDLTEVRTGEKSWAVRNARIATWRRPYLAGFEDGAFEERLRLVAFIAENIGTITEFAGERTPEMLSFILREMKPDAS